MSYNTSNVGSLVQAAHQVDIWGLVEINILVEHLLQDTSSHYL